MNKLVMMNSTLDLDTIFDTISETTQNDFNKNTECYGSSSRKRKINRGSASYFFDKVFSEIA